MELPSRSPSFRAIFAGGTPPLGITFQRADSPAVLAVVGFVTVFSTTASFLGYLSVRHQWTLLDPDGKPTDLLKTFFPRDDDVAAEVKTGLASEGILRYTASIF